MIINRHSNITFVDLGQFNSRMLVKYTNYSRNVEKNIAESQFRMWLAVSSGLKL